MIVSASSDLHVVFAEKRSHQLREEDLLFRVSTLLSFVDSGENKVESSCWGWLCSEMSDADHERVKFRERGRQRELC